MKGNIEKIKTKKEAEDIAYEETNKLNYTDKGIIKDIRVSETDKCFHMKVFIKRTTLFISDIKRLNHLQYINPIFSDADDKIELVFLINKVEED